MASGRVVPNPALLEQYKCIVQYGRSPYRNPLFRSGLLRALLQQRPWYECLADMLQQRPWPFFIRCQKTPVGIPWFSADAANKFQELPQRHQGDAYMAEHATSGPPPTPPLELLIFRLIQTYVNRKTEEKCGLNREDFKDRKIKDEKSGKERVDVPSEYRDAREKVASDAFLAMRSRREQDFVDFFTATVCSVGQFLKDDEYQLVANSLLHRPEDVKTLTLLALSANS
jgi:CRISPR-associated protein Cmx8